MKPFSRLFSHSGSDQVSDRGKAVIVLLSAIVIHALLVEFVVLRRAPTFDFFFYYLSCRVPLTGQSVYKEGAFDFEHPVFRDAARAFARRFSFPENFSPGMTADGQQALLYPPQPWLVFLPFSRLPFDIALTAWMAFLALLAVSCGTLSWTFDETDRHRTALTQALVAAAFLLNPLMEMYLSTGQATLLICAGVAMGRWMQRRGHQWLAAFLWSFCTIKPQLGLELMALSVLAGGWRFFARVCIATATLTVVAGLAVTGDPLMVLGLLDSGHVDEYHNHVWNSPRFFGIVSWNRIAYLLTGRVINLSLMHMFVGHISWIGLVVGRSLLRRGHRWLLPYWLAAAACGSLLGGSAHNSDVVLLILVVPYFFWLWDRGYTWDWAFLVALVVLAFFSSGFAVRAALNALGAGGTMSEWVQSYHALVLIALAAYLLIRGQPDQCGRRVRYHQGTSL